jgi:hypothetical protein
MSDQPKPTSKWTADSVAQILGFKSGSSLHFHFQTLAEIHNAALAAAYEKGKQERI